MSETAQLTPPRKGETDKLVAHVERDDLKSLFYLLAGKPDSVVKVFQGNVIIDKDGLVGLEGRIRSKLDQHHVESLVATVHLGCSGRITKEFSSWQDFDAYRMDGGEKTESLTLRWDFLVKLPLYEAPQRHTLTLRIAAAPNPADVLKMMTAANPEDHSAAEYFGAPIVCRVDFINSLLSDELINIVAAWHEGLVRPPSVSSLVKWLSRHEGTVHVSMHRGFEILFGSLACWLLLRHSGSLDLRIGLAWLLASVIFVRFAGSFGHWVARSLERAVSSVLSGVVFSLTNGDSNHQNLRLEAARKSWKKFVIRALVAVAANVVAGLVTAWILTG